MPAQASQGHFRDSYSVGDRLGKGAYAVVHKCVHRKTGEEYAVKVVDKSKAGPKDIDDLAHEINVMSEIGYHPHVVQMIEYFSTERHLYIVLDLLNGGMLFDRIVQLRHYSEQNAAELVRNLLSALQHIHSKGIIHRDLKPENLLLRYSETNVPDNASHLTDVCLADFGLAGYVPSTTCCGSPSYIAPEVIAAGYYLTRKDPYDAKCDIWSLGVITYILISGKMPFHGSNFKETFNRVVAGRWSFSGDIWNRVTPAARDFVTQCLRMEPEQRPSAGELLKHTWVADDQPDIHLEDSLESLRKFNAHQKMRAAVRVFCWTQQLLGGNMDRTPPFMRYLRHEDKYSTVVYHQSQTHGSVEHAVDFGKALDHEKPGFRMQDCCTCPSEMVCRHIQNVHEYLFVGCRNMEVFPFFDQLKMMVAEAEADLEEDPNNADATERLRRASHAMEAACVFSDELAKVPVSDLKPNFMLDASRNTLFREKGGSRSMMSSSQDARPSNEREEVAKKLADRFHARRQQKPAPGKGQPAPAAAGGAAPGGGGAAAPRPGQQPPRKSVTGPAARAKPASSPTSTGPRLSKDAAAAPKRESAAGSTKATKASTKTKTSKGRSNLCTD